MEGEWTEELTRRIMAVTHRIALRVATEKAQAQVRADNS